MPDDLDTFPKDIISKAENIALYLFGHWIEDMTGEERKRAIKKYTSKVYHLAETSRLPIFRVGSTLCARKSVLKRFVEEQEAQTAKNAWRPDPEQTESK